MSAEHARAIPLRVGFVPIGGAGWTGGRTWQTNLLQATTRFEPARVSPVVFCGPELPDDEAAQFTAIAGVEVVRSAAFAAAASTRRLARALVTGLDRDAVQAFAQHGIAVAFESAVFYGWRCPLPAIAWLPDFQHRRMRGQFGALARWKRELGFRAQVASGRLVMLSSEDARADCERFYPGSAGNTAVVRFAAPIDAALFEDDPLATARSYGLPPAFVYLPNQFWRHKNHAVAIEALALLRARGVEVTVAASGNPSDPRHPGHYEALRERVKALGLSAAFRFLGMIPRAHLVSLMRTCTLLLNPSQFEGWSSTVEEARALGVPLVLSGIGVHREQMGDAARYFDPGDPSALADALADALRHLAPPPMPRRSGPDAEANVRRFAADFAATVEHAVRRRQAGAARGDRPREAGRA